MPEVLTDYDPVADVLRCQLKSTVSHTACEADADDYFIICKDAAGVVVGCEVLFANYLYGLNASCYPEVPSVLLDAISKWLRDNFDACS